MAIADQYFTFYQAIKEKVGETAEKTAAKLSDCYPSTSSTAATANSIVDTAMDDLVFELTVELSRLTAGKYSVEPVNHSSSEERERSGLTQTRSGRISKRPNRLENSDSSDTVLDLILSPSPPSSPRRSRGSVKRLRWRGSPSRTKAIKKRRLCQQCGQSFASSSVLSAHQRRLHPIGRQATFRCRWPSCTANFSSLYMNNAIIHVRTAHLGLPPESTNCPKKELAKSYVVKV